MNSAGRRNADDAYAVRAATALDLDRVAEIKVRNWADTYGPLVAPDVLRPFLDREATKQELRDQMGSPGALLLVAQRGSEPLTGFALTYMAHAPEPWLESLHVLRDQRGRGLGTLLVRATAERLVAAGHRTMALGVVLGNDAAARFYERLGAARIRVELVDWADGVSHTVYRWSDIGALIG